MIRSARIPSVLRRICTDDVIQTALLVTTDGELLGSTATTFVSPDGTTKESIESLGSLIADIAVDYGKLGEEYANLDPPGSAATTTTATTASSSSATAAATAQAEASSSATVSSNASSSGGSISKSNPSATLSTTAATATATPPKSHLQCLFLELELGLVAVATCIGVDCMVIAIAAPDAPMGSIKARLQAITAHVQEQLSPLAIMGSGNNNNGGGGGTNNNNNNTGGGRSELVGSSPANHHQHSSGYR